MPVLNFTTCRVVLLTLCEYIEYGQKAFVSAVFHFVRLIVTLVSIMIGDIDSVL